jgi:hypothetical protein
MVDYDGVGRESTLCDFPKKEKRTKMFKLICLIFCTARLAIVQSHKNCKITQNRTISFIKRSLRTNRQVNSIGSSKSLFLHAPFAIISKSKYQVRCLLMSFIFETAKTKRKQAKLNTALSYMIPKAKLKSSALSESFEETNSGIFFFLFQV